MQCYNTGSDGYDASWKCEASMPEGYSFSWIEVRLRRDGDAYRRRTRRSTLLDSWAGEVSRAKNARDISVAFGSHAFQYGWLIPA